MLTAENIQTQQFHVRFRGFDVDEVDAFLEKVAEHYTLLAEENKRMEAELEAMQGQQAANQSQEDTFKNAIISAQTIADEMKKKATEEADVAISSAREQATAIVDEANSKVAHLEEQITALQGEKARIKDELRDFLTSQIDNLENEISTASMTSAPIHEPGQDPQAEPGLELEPAKEQQDEVPEFEARDDDLTDLYEKIELPDDLAGDLNLENVENPMEQSSADTQESTPAPEELSDLSFATNLLGDDQLPDPASIPDLDDDMLFTLEDPLDPPEEPAVVIEPLKKTEE